MCITWVLSGIIQRSAVHAGQTNYGLFVWVKLMLYVYYHIVMLMFSGALRYLMPER